MKARLPKGYGGGGPQNMQQMLKQAQNCLLYTSPSPRD